MSSCPSCEFDNRGGVRFCEECGQELTAAVSVVHVACAACGAGLRPGTSFCEECGHTIDPAATEPMAPDLVAPVPKPTVLACDSCGRHNREGLRFCEHCGTSLTAASTSDIGERPSPTPRPHNGDATDVKPGRRRKWWMGAAAVGAIVVAGGGIIAFQSPDDPGDDPVATTVVAPAASSPTVTAASGTPLPETGPPDVAVVDLAGELESALSAVPDYVDPSQGMALRLDDRSAALYDGTGWSVIKKEPNGQLGVWRPSVDVGGVENRGGQSVFVPSATLPPPMLDWLDTELVQYPGLEKSGTEYVVTDEAAFAEAIAVQPLPGMSWRPSDDGIDLVDDLQTGMVNVIVEDDQTWIVADDQVVLAIPDPGGEDGAYEPVGVLSSCAAKSDLTGCAGRSGSDAQVFWEPFPEVEQALLDGAEQVLASLPWLSDNGAGGWEAPDMILEAPTKADTNMASGIWADAEEFIASGAEAAWAGVNRDWVPQVLTADEMSAMVADSQRTAAELLAAIYPSRLVWDGRTHIGGYPFDTSVSASFSAAVAEDDGGKKKCSLNPFSWDKCVDKAAGSVKKRAKISKDGLVRMGKSGVVLVTAGTDQLNAGFNTTIDAGEAVFKGAGGVVVTLAGGGEDLVVTGLEYGGIGAAFVFDIGAKISSFVDWVLTDCLTNSGCGHGPPTQNVSYRPPGDPSGLDEHGIQTYLASMWFPYLQFSKEESCGSLPAIVADVFTYGPTGMPVSSVDEAHFVEIIYTVFYDMDGGRCPVGPPHAGDNEGFGIGLVRTARVGGRCETGFEFVGARSSAHLNFHKWIGSTLGERYVSHISHDETTASEVGACPARDTAGEYRVLVSEDKHGSYFHRSKCEEEIPGVKNLLSDMAGGYVATVLPASGLLVGPLAQQATKTILEELPGGGGLEECEDGRDPVDLSGMVQVSFTDAPVTGKYAHGKSFEQGLRGRWRPDSVDFEVRTEGVCGGIPEGEPKLVAGDRRSSRSNDTDHSYHVPGLFDGRRIEEGPVPHVIGSPVVEACWEFARAGFQSTFDSISSVDRQDLEGTVTEQNPVHGTFLRFGSTVICARGDYSDLGDDVIASQVIPYVLGMSESRARAEITAAGFKIAVEYESVSDSNQDGIVIRQDPEANLEEPTKAFALEGSTITVAIGSYTAPPPTQTCVGVEATIVGTDAGEQLIGTSGNDVIVALGGADIIYGGGGDDLICAGAGADSIFGEAGNDALFGEDGDDHLEGGSGSDSTNGGSGGDWCDGEDQVACEDGPSTGVALPDFRDQEIGITTDWLDPRGVSWVFHEEDPRVQCGDHESVDWEITGQTPSPGTLVNAGDVVNLTIVWYTLSSSVCES